MSGRRIGSGTGSRPGSCRKKACRFRLRVTARRRERLDLISEADAQAEGFAGDHAVDDPHRSARERFRAHWVALYGQPAWDERPMIWVLTYERLSR